jgi:hypothetical protein
LRLISMSYHAVVCTPSHWGDLRISQPWKEKVVWKASSERRWIVMSYKRLSQEHLWQVPHSVAPLHEFQSVFTMFWLAYWKGNLNTCLSQDSLATMYARLGGNNQWVKSLVIFFWSDPSIGIWHAWIGILWVGVSSLSQIVCKWWL